MASIDERPDGTYRARWREYPGGPQKTKHFRLKRDAKAHIHRVEADRSRGVYVDPQLGREPLVDMIERHNASQPWRYNTVRNADWALEHVRRHFGDQPIGQITTSDLQTFVSRLARSLDAGSIRTVWRFLRQTFRAAHLDGFIGRDPCPRVRLPRHQGDELVIPTDDEVRVLRDGAPDDFAVAVVLGALLGLRASEAAGLTVDRIDFLRREVRVDRQWHGKLDQFEPVKYASSNRTIPAGDRALELMAFHLEHHGSGQHGVLLHADGRPLNSNRMDWRWTQTTRAAGSELTFHSLRHYFASSLLSSGRCSIVAVQRALGHSSASITLDTYGHLMPSDADRVRLAVDETWKAAEDWLRTDEQREAR